MACCRSVSATWHGHHALALGVTMPAAQHTHTAALAPHHRCRAQARDSRTQARMHSRAPPRSVGRWGLAGLAALLRS